MRGKHYTPRPRHCPGPSHLQRKSGFEISKIAPALKTAPFRFLPSSPFVPRSSSPREIANRGQLERVEEVGDTKATIDYSREDEKKKRMYRNITGIHRASIINKKSCIFYKFSKLANYECHKTIMYEKERNEILLSN